MSQSSQFYPRPEAQATKWDELLLPVQLAVRDLLVRINGAHQSISFKNPNGIENNSTPQIGNCFMVYGSRGTGKTTVLLNAQRAVSKKKEENEKFFGKEEGEEAKKQAKKQADYLREAHLVWLEILNLEPLPSEANLLTVLLTQVRNALHTSNNKREQRSVFEEEANSARQQLIRLINDATLMWQNIKEQDTRNISNRQVKAADIYADFQENFKKAMDTLVKELSPVNEDKKISIVLPIDNIDRSTDHLQSIVKLAQLVSHPNLWLVMAGDRVEIETFLERSYWKELIRSSDGAGAQGKIDGDGEDEALVMARRQANAIAQKLWPANHRVEVDFVKPDKTLCFFYKHHSVNGTNPLSIKDLLKSIQIPTTKTIVNAENKQVLMQKNMTLLDLFDVTNQVGKSEDKQPRLTRAAHHGLLLPARSVLDLWQLLDWLVNDTSFGGDNFKAEKVARTMLRNAIASSQMPNWIAQDLQNNILRRGENSGTILYFNKTYSLNLMLLTVPIYDFEYALAPVIPKPLLQICELRSQLIIYNVEDIILFLQKNYLAIDPSNFSKNICPQHFVIENIHKKSEIELPSLVAAWLIILYDILMIADSDSGITGSSLDIELVNVSINHTIVTQVGKLKHKMDVELRWNAPDWELFFGRNILGLLWQDFRKMVAKNLLINQQQPPNLTSRLLAAGWILCALITSIRLITSIDACSKKFELIAIPMFSFTNSNYENILDFEDRVMKMATTFYELIQDEKRCIKHAAAAYEVMIATGKWLETELVYFLSYGYVPIEPKASEERFKTMWLKLEKTTLQDYWRRNSSFILAELDEKLSVFEFGKNQGSSKDLDETNPQSLAELLFADLYQKLSELSNG